MTTASSAEHPTRRDFLFVATGAFAAVGGVASLWPFVSQMNPDASTIAAGAPIEVDLPPRGTRAPAASQVRTRRFYLRAPLGAVPPAAARERVWERDDSSNSG